MGESQTRTGAAADAAWARTVVDAVTADLDGVARELTVLMVREIGVLGGQDALGRGMLEDSVQSNVAAITAAVARRSEDAAEEAPAPAIAYARLLAQRDVPLSALLRAYRIGHARFISRCLEVAETLDLPPRAAGTIWLVDRCAAYIDAVSEQVGAAYEDERDRWASRRTARRQRWVERLLSGQEVDVAAAQAALGYDLRGCHVAIEAWAPHRSGATPDDGVFDVLLSALQDAPEIGGRCLLIPVDDRDARLWLSVRPGRFDVIGLRDRLLEHDLGVRLALGDPAPGPAGFRRSHRQAVAARGVAEVGQAVPAVITFAEVGPVALLGADVEAAQDWAAGVLGPLGDRDDRARWLRETLLVFLDEGSSFAVAADRLTIHRNTVQYRVQQATEARGRPIDEDRYDVHLALRVCRWLGPPASDTDQGPDAGA